MRIIQLMLILLMGYAPAAYAKQKQTSPPHKVGLLGAQPQTPFGVYVSGLPAATTPLSGSDRMYVLQNGTSKSVPGISVGGTLTIGSTIVSGGVVGNCLTVITGPLLSQQASCGNLIVGTTSVASGLPNGLLFNSSGTLQNNGPVVSPVTTPTGNGQWGFGSSPTLGVITIGQGSTSDWCAENSAGVCALSVPTGTTNAIVAGTISATINNVATTSAVCYNTATGLFSYDGTIGTCNTSSMRFKHDIRPLAETQPNPLEAVLKMRPASFVYNEDQHVAGQQLGLMAEELAAIDPRLVGYDAQGQPNSIRYLGPIVAYLVGAIQQQQAEIEALRARVK